MLFLYPRHSTHPLQKSLLHFSITEWTLHPIPSLFFCYIFHITEMINFYHTFFYLSSYRKKFRKFRLIISISLIYYSKILVYKHWDKINKELFPSCKRTNIITKIQYIYITKIPIYMMELHTTLYLFIRLSGTYKSILKGHMKSIIQNSHFCHTHIM